MTPESSLKELIKKSCEDVYWRKYTRRLVSIIENLIDILTNPVFDDDKQKLYEEFLKLYPTELGIFSFVATKTLPYLFSEKYTEERAFLLDDDVLNFTNKSRSFYPRFIALLHSCPKTDIGCEWEFKLEEALALINVYYPIDAPSFYKNASSLEIEVMLDILVEASILKFDVTSKIYTLDYTYFWGGAFLEKK